MLASCRARIRPRARRNSREGDWPRCTVEVLIGRIPAELIESSSMSLFTSRRQDPYNSHVYNEKENQRSCSARDLMYIVKSRPRLYIKAPTTSGHCPPLCPSSTHASSGIREGYGGKVLQRFFDQRRSCHGRLIPSGPRRASPRSWYALKLLRPSLSF